MPLYPTDGKQGKEYEHTTDTGETKEMSRTVYNSEQQIRAEYSVYNNTGQMELYYLYAERTHEILPDGKEMYIYYNALTPDTKEPKSKSIYGSVNSDECYTYSQEEYSWNRDKSAWTGTNRTETKSVIWDQSAYVVPSPVADVYADYFQQTSRNEQYRDRREQVESSWKWDESTNDWRPVQLADLRLTDGSFIKKIEKFNNDGELQSTRYYEYHWKDDNKLTGYITKVANSTDYYHESEYEYEYDSDGRLIDAVAKQKYSDYSSVSHSKYTYGEIEIEDSGLDDAVAGSSVYTLTGNCITVAAPADIYSVAGVPVSRLGAGESCTLAPGFYIVRVGGEAVKVAVGR